MFCNLIAFVKILIILTVVVDAVQNDAINLNVTGNIREVGSLTECSCGLVDEKPRIMGGKDVYPAVKFSWHVSIKRFYNFVCSGSLVSDRFVLTAASCFFTIFGSRIPDHYLTVGVGVQRMVNDENGVYYPSERVFIHPSFAPSLFSHEYNLALIKLKESPLKNFSPVCLPPATLTDSHLYSKGVVTGWGKRRLHGVQNNVLQEVEVSIKKDCSLEFQDDSFVICAEFSSQKGICQGDIGSPLVVKKNGAWIIIGVAIYDQTCGYENLGKHSKFTKVGKFVDWILSYVQDFNVCFIK